MNSVWLALCSKPLDGQAPILIFKLKGVKFYWTGHPTCVTQFVLHNSPARLVHYLPLADDEAEVQSRVPSSGQDRTGIQDPKSQAPHFLIGLQHKSGITV